MFRSEGALTLDYEWYLSNQILPPITRLCEPIEGTSSAILASKLGLDSSKFAKSSTSDELGDDGWGFTPRCQMDDAERFKECCKLTYTCSLCNQEQAFPGPISEVSGCSGLSCGQCGAMYLGLHNPADCYSYLSNRVTLLVRQCVQRYYNCWLVCDDHSCARRTMQQSVKGYACTEECHGRMVQEYDEAALHTQLKFLETLFDFPRAVSRRAAAASEGGGSSSSATMQFSHSIPKEHVEVFSLLKQHMSNAVNGSAYNWVRPSLWSTVFGRVLAK